MKNELVAFVHYQMCYHHYYPRFVVVAVIVIVAHVLARYYLL